MTKVQIALDYADHELGRRTQATSTIRGRGAHDEALVYMAARDGGDDFVLLVSGNEVIEELSPEDWVRNGGLL